MRQAFAATASLFAMCFWNLASLWVLRNFKHCLAIMQVLCLPSRINMENTYCWVIRLSLCIFVATKSMFAWVLVVIACSFAFLSTWSCFNFSALEVQHHEATLPKQLMGIERKLCHIHHAITQSMSNLVSNIFIMGLNMTLDLK